LREVKKNTRPNPQQVNLCQNTRKNIIWTQAFCSVVYEVSLLMVRKRVRRAPLGFQTAIAADFWNHAFFHHV
jgi:hypothetical protein